MARESRDRLADRTAPVVPAQVRVDGAARELARQMVGEGARLPRLLGAADPSAAVGSLAVEMAYSGARAPVSRYLSLVRASRVDVHAQFPRAPGRDARGLARWALDHLDELTDPDSPDGGLNASLVRLATRATLDAVAPDGRNAAAVAVAAPARTSGVNLVGYLSGELGLGESARLMGQALAAGGIETTTVDVSAHISSRRGAVYAASRGAARETTLVCVNAPETAAVVASLSPELRGDRVIAMWYWELEELPPSQRVGFAHVDEVWVATEFMRKAFASYAGSVPVRVVTPPLPQATRAAPALPDRFGLPSHRPWFLFTFDYLSDLERKNPLGVLEAFTRAFANRAVADRPLLVIKTINADRRYADAERLRLAAAGREDVKVLEEYLDHDERHALVAHCTAYVSLHRSEGLGLTVAEAMAWGRPVVVTDYGGTTQFCDAENAFLVDWSSGRVQRPDGPYPRGARWAEPDLDHAARLLRRIVDEPTVAAAVGRRAARDIRSRHGVAAAAEQVRDALGRGGSAAPPPVPATGVAARPGRWPRVSRALRGRRDREHEEEA